MKYGGKTPKYDSEADALAAAKEWLENEKKRQRHMWKARAVAGGLQLLG